MKKNLQISLEDAKELLKTNPFLKESLEELFPELRSKVKDRFEDLRTVEGWYMDSFSSIMETGKNCLVSENNKNIFAKHSQALSSLAYAQLTQLMKDTGDCEDIDWVNKHTKKYSIIREENKIRTYQHYTTYTPIAFKTESIRDEFFEKHRELLKQYFQIQ